MQEMTINNETLVSRIYFIRGEKVMLDFDLALLYETETRILKQAVRRNIKRFPPDFMFELTKLEWNELITNCDNLLQYKFSPALPFAFTEQGVAMLSSVLKSEKAIEVNIAIMRTFVQLRRLMGIHKELAERIDKLELKYDKHIHEIFQLIQELIIQETKPKIRIGFLTEE
ncbi:MAG: hypothetical protein QG635_2499 [Bacteroidota bacterium]|nr:hypothetical protein [Bacteroidota bacterium]